MKKRAGGTDPVHPEAFTVAPAGKPRFKYQGPRIRSKVQGPGRVLGEQPLEPMVEATPFGLARDGESSVPTVPGRGARMMARGGKDRQWAIDNLGIPDTRPVEALPGLFDLGHALKETSRPFSPPTAKTLPPLPGTKDLKSAIRGTDVLRVPTLSERIGPRPTIDNPWDSGDYRNRPDFSSKDPYAKLRNKRPGNTPLPKKAGN